MAGAEVRFRVRHLDARVNGHPEFVAEVVPELVALLNEYQDARVIAAIVEALGHASDEQASLLTLPFVGHSDPAVRLAVAQALPGPIESDEAIAAVAEALVRLSRDDDDQVRDWATFGLGSTLLLDTSEVREALWARITDSSGDVRDEALVGLAHRRDRHVLALVGQRLAGDSAGRLVFESAEYLAHPDLLDWLDAWLADNPDDDEILRAQRACDPGYQAARTERQGALLASVQRLLDQQGQRRVAVLYCERLRTDVLLEVGTYDGCWFVDAVLDGTDIEHAARLILSEISE